MIDNNLIYKIKHKKFHFNSCIFAVAYTFLLWPIFLLWHILVRPVFYCMIRRRHWLRSWQPYKEKALATVTAAIHQNKNSRDTAVLLGMLSLLSINNHIKYGSAISEESLAIDMAENLLMSEDFHLFSLCNYAVYAKPNPN